MHTGVNSSYEGMSQVVPQFWPHVLLRNQRTPIRDARARTHTCSSALVRMRDLGPVFTITQWRNYHRGTGGNCLPALLPSSQIGLENMSENASESFLAGQKLKLEKILGYTSRYATM